MTVILTMAMAVAACARSRPDSSVSENRASADRSPAVMVLLKVMKGVMTVIPTTEMAVIAIAILRRDVRVQDHPVSVVACAEMVY